MYTCYIVYIDIMCLFVCIQSSHSSSSAFVKTIPYSWPGWGWTSARPALPAHTGPWFMSFWSWGTEAWHKGNRRGSLQAAGHCCPTCLLGHFFSSSPRLSCLPPTTLSLAPSHPQPPSANPLLNPWGKFYLPLWPLSRVRRLSGLPPMNSKSHHVTIVLDRGLMPASWPMVMGRDSVGLPSIWFWSIGEPEESCLLPNLWAQPWTGKLVTPTREETKVQR